MLSDILLLNPPARLLSFFPLRIQLFFGHRKHHAQLTGKDRDLEGFHHAPEQGQLLAAGCAARPIVFLRQPPELLDEQLIFV